MHLFPHLLHPSGIYSPVHGNWNIAYGNVGSGGNSDLYVCADNCMRGAPTAAEMNAADRFSFAVEEQHVLNGNLKTSPLKV